MRLRSGDIDRLQAEGLVDRVGKARAGIVFSRIAQRVGKIADQLDGELVRMQGAAEYGLIPPDFLIAKALPQMRAALANAENSEGSLVTSLAGRTESIRPQT